MRVSDRAAYVLATWFGCGLSPAAPGTVGAIGAVPLHVLLSRLAEPVHAAAVVALSAIGVWAAGRVAASSGDHDPQRVVIDEVAGVLLAMGTVRDLGWKGAAFAFVLFRVLDITKPGPIRRAEQFSPVGVGIMADDLLAGALAGMGARLGAFALGTL
jgi:phosphatidylglycerophosphatase A